MKTNIKALISELSVVEKIELLDCLYHELSGHGTDGDTELAHINTREAAVLKALGGSGTVNEITGLRQFGKSSPPPPPSSQSVEQKIPEEISPYIKDILAKGQAIQEQRTAEGYRPYQGPQLAEFTPEQQQSFTGISGLVGTGQQYFDPAARLTAAAAMQPTGQEVSQYMSPYMQQVVDIQQREAQRQADVAGQQLSAQAVGAGGFGGSRQAILEAEAARNLQTQLGDIQAKGLAAAYEDAQARLAAQRQRQLASGAQFAQMAPSALSTALQEQTALQQVGGLKQTQSQAALDIAKGQFEAEKTFPEQTLQQYSSLIRGYAMDPNITKTTTTPAPSTIQQLAGLGSLGTGLYAASKMFKKGGKVGDGKGIASIIVKRKNGGSVVKLQAGGSFGFNTPLEEQFTRQELDPYLSLSIPELQDYLNINDPKINNIVQRALEIKSQQQKPTEAQLATEQAKEAADAGPGDTGNEVGIISADGTVIPANKGATASQAAQQMKNVSLFRGANKQLSEEDKDLKSRLSLYPPDILRSQMKAGDEYVAAISKNIQEMRDNAKSRKETDGIIFVQEVLGKLAGTKAGASFGAMLAEAAPSISEATKAAVVSQREVEKELRAAGLKEKEIAYAMSKDIGSIKLDIYKALQKAGVSDKDLAYIAEKIRPINDKQAILEYSKIVKDGGVKRLAEALAGTIKNPPSRQGTGTASVTQDRSNVRTYP